MSERVLNRFSSIQFLETKYARHAGRLRRGFCVFDVINTIALSAQFVFCNTPAIYSCIFHSCIFHSRVFHSCIFHSCIFHSRIFRVPLREMSDHSSTTNWGFGLQVQKLVDMKDWFPHKRNTAWSSTSDTWKSLCNVFLRTNWYFPWMRNLFRLVLLQHDHREHSAGAN